VRCPKLLPALLAAASLAVALPVRAQDDEEDVGGPERQVTATAVLIPEAGATPSDVAIVGIGLRRGVRQVEGVKFVHPADVLSTQEMPESVIVALDDLEPIADMVRTGDANDALRRAEAAIEAFEANLEVVPRSSLVDAYMLKALAECQRGRRRPCVEGFEYVLTFREGAAYDPVRYPPEHQELFEETRQRLLEEGLRGSVQVTTEQPGAEVFVDGRSYGPSPVVALGLLVGEHYVTVKSTGYQKEIRRVTVNERYEEQVHIELTPSERALLLERDLPRIRGELGRERAGRFISGLDAYLFTNQVILGVVRPAPGDQIDVTLYLYDLRTRFLLAQHRATITADEAGMVLAQELATELYRGVDLTGAVEAPEQELVVEEPSPFWQQWWFWTAVGVVVVSGVVAFSVLGGDDQGPPEGWTRIGWQFR